MRIKKVVFLSNGYLENWISFLIENLACGFAVHGLEMEICDVQQMSQQDVPKFLDDLTEFRPDQLLVTFCGRIEFPNCKPDGNPYKLGCPHFTWLVDNPAHYLKYVSTCDERTILGLVEPDHQKVLKALGRNLRSLTLPHGEFPRDVEVLKISERERSVIFSGSIHDAFDPMNMKKVNAPELHPMIDAVDMAIHDQAENHTVSLDAFSKALEHHSIDYNKLPTPLIATFLTVLEAESNSLVRRRLLRVLPNITDVHVYGTIADPTLLGHKNVKFYGKKPFADVKEFSKSCKATLCLTPKFKQAFTERFWAALSVGSVPLVSQQQANEASVSIDLSQSDAFLEENLRICLSNEILQERQALRHSRPSNLLSLNDQVAKLLEMASS